jgi:prepilin-type N-terminal cleavage/methylation domain-containing protein
MRRARSEFPDDGFTLVEVSVSLVIVSIVMASVTAFFIDGLRSVHRQGEQQTAAELALDGMEQARTLRGKALLAGRAICTSCPTATGASTYLTTTERWDAASSDGVTPTLPRPGSPDVRTVDGIDYRRYWYAGRCWTPRTGGACVNSPANPLSFYRVVVAVTWPDTNCNAGTCSFVTSALFSGNLLDPVFEPA